MTELDNSRLSADDQRIIAEAREVAALGADDIRTYIHETDTLNRAQHLLAELARVATRLGERTAPAPACAWPQCGNYVSPGDLCCRDHWYRLPRGHRDAVRAALEWVRGQAGTEAGAK